MEMQIDERQAAKREPAGDGRFDAPVYLLAPDGTRDDEALPLAERPASFAGKVLGVLDNRKHNSERLLMSVAEMLRGHFDLGDVRLHKKPAFNVEVAREQLAEMTRGCDLVLTGIGD